MPLFTTSEADDFGKSFQRVMQTMSKIGKSVETVRERTFLEVGLRSAHIEEAVAHNEYDRANSHLVKMVELIKQL